MHSTLDSDPGHIRGVTESRSGSKILLTVEEGCDRLSVSRTTMFALLKAGDIRSVKIGKARRIVADSLHEFVNTKLADVS